MAKSLSHLKVRLQHGLTIGILSVFVCSFAVMFPGVRLRAQAITGISGTVVDASGAVIPGAHVTATNTSTGVLSRTVTSSAGTFTIVGLIPGSYSVVVNAAGCKGAQTNVTVEIAKISTASFKMALGATTATVQVKALAISLQTSSSVIGTTLEPELVKTAPIEINSLVRQIDSFMYLAPGVQGELRLS